MKSDRSIESFVPAVWGAQIDGELFLILVCAASQQSSGYNFETRGGVNVDKIVHPVAIRIGAPAQILYGFKIESHEWLVKTAEEFGLHPLNAQRALAEAWRGVEEITHGAYPERKWNFRFRVNMIRSLTDCREKHEQTMFRNVNLWLRWGLWESQKSSRRQRALELTAMGIPTDEKKINKVLENAGL